MHSGAVQLASYPFNIVDFLSVFGIIGLKDGKEET
jgi:hypothetical protein